MINPALPFSIVALAMVAGVAWRYFFGIPASAVSVQRKLLSAVSTAFGWMASLCSGWLPPKGLGCPRNQATDEKRETGRVFTSGRPNGIKTPAPFNPSELTPELRDKILRSIRRRLREEFLAGVRGFADCDRGSKAGRLSSTATGSNAASQSISAIADQVSGDWAASTPQGSQPGNRSAHLISARSCQPPSADPQPGRVSSTARPGSLIHLLERV